jgi:hypothetical protein
MPLHHARNIEKNPSVGDDLTSSTMLDEVKIGERGFRASVGPQEVLILALRLHMNKNQHSGTLGCGLFFLVLISGISK